MYTLWFTACFLTISARHVLTYDEYWWRYIRTNSHHYKRQGNYGNYLHQNPSHHQFINLGVITAHNECKRLFKYKRWNCESNSILKPFGDIVDLGCRETAFIYAITSAGMTYELIRACSQGKIAGCIKTCVKENFDIKKTRLHNATHTLNPACNDNIQFGKEAWNNFVYKGERFSDIRASFNIRNSIVGMKETERSATFVCKCHGVTGSCIVRVCSKKVPLTFDTIGDKIHKKYISARFDIPDQRKIETNSNHIIRHQYFPTGVQMEPIKSRRIRSLNIFNVRDLEFYENSPDFCDKSRYFKGTGNRVCNNKVSQRQYLKGMQGCREICCRGKSSRRVKVLVKKNCKFHFCCKVTCDEMLRTFKEHFCL